ncbi:MAG: hypothetical protein HQL36_06790, partial [Alphaproteobacteria bacterium]|nr:hypothetical protein [Alphaproteobacteria bacterium]
MSANVQFGGVRAVQMRSGETPVHVVRRIDAMMMATPYLGWTWRLTDHGEGSHPVRLVVGFRGGAASPTARPLADPALPPHDRALAVAWGDTALRRGALEPPPANRPHDPPVYTARGGRENTRIWWTELVDLSKLYIQAWPGDDVSKAAITFIGMT